MIGYLGFRGKDSVSVELRELVAGCLAEDPQATVALIQRFRSRVFGLCYRMLGQWQDAEDAVQETFLRVIRSLPKWDADREFEPWVLAIAANRCRTQLAKRKREVPTEALIDRAPADWADDASRRATHLREELQLAMRSLPAEQVAAFRMFHNEGRAYQEIAQSLARPIGTVKTWVHRTRRHVLSELHRRKVVDAR